MNNIPFKPGNPLSPGGPGRPIAKERLPCNFILLSYKTQFIPGNPRSPEGPTGPGGPTITYFI